jgi:hypothetical protein
MYNLWVSFRITRLEKKMIAGFAFTEGHSLTCVRVHGKQAMIFPSGEVEGRHLLRVLVWQTIDLRDHPELLSLGAHVVKYNYRCQVLAFPAKGSRVPSYRQIVAALATTPGEVELMQNVPEGMALPDYLAKV